MNVKPVRMTVHRMLNVRIHKILTYAHVSQDMLTFLLIPLTGREGDAC